jgi:hypothetical protein
MINQNDDTQKALCLVLLFTVLLLSAVSCTLAFNYWVALPEKPHAVHNVRQELITSVDNVEQELAHIHGQLDKNQLPSSAKLTAMTNELAVHAKSDNATTLIVECRNIERALAAKDLIRAQQAVINAEHACRAVQNELTLMRQTNGH